MLGKQRVVRRYCRGKSCCLRSNRVHSIASPQVEGIGKEEPLSEEKLCPVLAMYRARDFDDAIAKADKLVGTS